MASPCDENKFLHMSQHSYSKSQVKIRERVASFIHNGDEDHAYASACTVKTTPIKKKRKHVCLTPTGETPKQPTKKQQIVASQQPIARKQWSVREKQELQKIVKSNPKRDNESDTQWWIRCAHKMNDIIPESTRTGRSCKSTYARLCIGPSFQNEQLTNAPTTVTCDMGTQTDLCLMDSYSHNINEHMIGDWVFMEPKKQLKEGASKGAGIVHSTALKRMRRYQNLKSNERAHLIKLLCTCDSAQIAREMLSTSLGDHIQQVLLNDLELQARDCATHSSTLHQHQYRTLVSFNWEDIIQEVVTKQPFLLEVLLSIALPTGKIGNSKSTESAVPVLGTIYGILMKERYHELSKVQKVVTMCLANEQVNQKVYDRLQPMGITVSHSSVLTTMTSIAGSFNDALIESVMKGKHFRLVGDNVNFHLSVSHERKNAKRSAHMEHWFGSIAVVQNVNFDVRPDVTPQCNLLELPVDTFIMNELDWDLITYDFTVLVARTLTDFFFCFDFAKDVANEALEVDMPVELKKKNLIIPLPVMNKNEQKYAEVIDVLDQYQLLCESVYTTCNKEVPQIHIGGDQLTRERFYGAKRLRASALTDSERLENLSPITFELFHLQMTFLTMFYDILYSTKNTETFTLHSQKIRLLRQDADGSNVKIHYNSCKELAISFIRAYIVEAACQHFNLSNVNDIPDWLPDHKSMNKNEIKVWLMKLVQPIVLSVTSDSKKLLRGENVEEQLNAVKSYGNVVLELGLIFMGLNDIIKHPSRIRFLCLMKYVMLMLKGHRNKSKYALEILRLLCQQFAILSEKTACESFYGLFVNTGKAIIPADLQMEFVVKLTKGHLRSMCSNKTESAMIKRSSAFFGMDQIAKNFDKQTQILNRAQGHKRPSSHEDELRIIADLHKVTPFMDCLCRGFPSASKSPKIPLKKLNMEQIRSWISCHKNLMYYEF